MSPCRSLFWGVLISAWLPVTLVAIIWAATVLQPSPFAPPPDVILQRFASVWFGDGFVTDVLPSLRNLFAGFAIALVVGVLGGAFLALVPVVEYAIHPFLEFLRALPGIALLPILLVMFGTGAEGKIILIALAAVWPILLNTIDGIRSINPLVLESARSYRITRLNYLFRVILPGAFPQMSVGIRLSLSICLVVVVGSEYYGSLEGIGAFVLNAKEMFRIADMWSGVLLLGILGYVLSIGYSAFEDRMLRWRDKP